MPVTNTTTNYTGRTKDINILKFKDFKVNTPLPNSLEFGNPSQIATGIHKLMQRYAIIFLTSLASQPNFLDFGTSFLSDIQGASNDRSVNSFKHTFNFANLEVRRVFLAYQGGQTNLSEDEQLARANLLDINYNNGVLALRVEIQSVAGTTVNFVLPIPFN